MSDWLYLNGEGLGAGAHHLQMDFHLCLWLGGCMALSWLASPVRRAVACLVFIAVQGHISCKMT